MAVQELPRRTFLKESLAGIFVLSSTRLFPFSSLVATSLQSEREHQLSYCSEDEYLILHAVAERIIGLSPEDPENVRQIDVALRADRFLAEADPEIQEQIHQLLTAFNAPFFTFLFDFRFSSFLNMTPEDQDSYLEDWKDSAFAFRRTGFQALKRICLSMFYTEERSWKEIGYDGMFLPGDRP